MYPYPLTFDLFHGTQSAGCVGCGPILIAIATIIGGQIGAQAIVQKGHGAGNHGAGAFCGSHQVCHLTQSGQITRKNKKKNTNTREINGVDHSIIY